MEFSEKVLKARKAAGKTQEGVARELGVGVRVYQGYEYGQSKPRDRRSLERVLNLPVGALDDEPMNASDQMEYIKTTAHALMAEGKLSEVDLQAFLDEMLDITEIVRQRLAEQEGKPKGEVNE